VLGYAIVSWTGSLVFLALMLLGLGRYLQGRWGLAGVALTGLLATLALRGIFAGIFGGEVTNMLLLRRKRTGVWLGGLTALALLAWFVRMDDRARGSFHVRPSTRSELRAPVAGFLRAVHFDEGDRVAAGATVAQIEIPDLESRVAQKQAELRESEARLRQIEAGPRPEEVAEGRARVTRARAWKDRAEQDLDRARHTLREDLKRLDEQIAQSDAELEFARHSYAHAERLVQKGVLAGEQYQEEKKRLQIAQSLREQALAQKRSRQALGTADAESELARREKDLADTESSLALLEAGARPEEIEAERARLARLQEERRYLAELGAKVLVRSPVAGIVSTPRLKEKVGQHLDEGAPICVVEDLGMLEAEMALREDELNGVQPGQPVQFKARALPFRTFEGTVSRVAPNVVSHESRSTVTVYCNVQNAGAELRPGMTGLGRIARGRQPMAALMGTRALKYLRTEFWW
jgi:multidrug resistance efflux pump